MKQKGIFIRLSEEDKSAIEQDAWKLGLSVTAFIRLLYKQWSDGIRFERRNTQQSGVEAEHAEASNKL